MSRAEQSLVRWKEPLILFVVCVLFVLGFDHNQWSVVGENRFKTFETDSESLVMARMTAARQYGIFSYGALMGWGDADPLNLNASDYQHQYDVYLARGDFQTYSVYKSQTGFQALIFAVLDRLSPFAPIWNLRLFRGLMAICLGVTLSLFIFWIRREFGWFTAGLVFITTLLSPWITVFGRNLFYFTWAFYLPMVLGAFYLAWEAQQGVTSNSRLGWLVFAAVTFKCLFNGYDFIVPSLGMVFVPPIYYGFRDHWNVQKFTVRFLILALACTAGAIAGILVLAAQLQTVDGSFAAGITDILSTFGRRTYGDPSLYSAVYTESLKANPLSVLMTYLFRESAMAFINLHFIDLIVIFAVFTALYFAADRLPRLQLTDRSRAYALMGAAWLSLLSPLSWYLIFKGQAYVHTHTNYLAWYMPFTLFGFAMCGYVCQSLFRAWFTAKSTVSE